MSTGSNNPPLPGKGITPEQSPKQSEPPFNRAAAGGEPTPEPIKLQHNLDIKFGPDGSAVKTNEAQRQKDLAARVEAMTAQIEQEKLAREHGTRVGYGMISTDPVKLEDEEARRAGDVLQARVYTFEDGQARHFTAKVRYWKSFDDLLESGGRLDQALWVPFDTARARTQEGKIEDFETELRACFDQLMRMAWAYLPENRKQSGTNSSFLE